MNAKKQLEMNSFQTLATELDAIQKRNVYLRNLSLIVLAQLFLVTVLINSPFLR